MVARAHQGRPGFDLRYERADEQQVLRVHTRIICLRDSRLVVSFGDCAVTGNVPSLRNKLGVDDLLTAVYHEGPGRHPRGDEPVGIMPELLPRVLPLHQVIAVDAYIPGCPPDPERIWAAVSALLAGEPVVLKPEMRRFG